MNAWWKEENWPRLKKDLDIWRNPTVDGMCDEGDLKVDEDPVP